jgi:hypothetical protein
MAGAYDADMAGSAPGSHEAERNSVYVVVQVTHLISPRLEIHVVTRCFYYQYIMLGIAAATLFKTQ